MKISDVITKMIEYYQGDARRIQHFMKAYVYARAAVERAKDKIFKTKTEIHYLEMIFYES